MQVTVRQWTAEDIYVAEKIEKACFSAPWDCETLTTALLRSDIVGLLLEADGELVGYALGSVVCEDADVLRIAVLKTRRGEGLGGKLFDALLSEMKARGAERVFLEVRTSNAPAIGLYEKRGFYTLRERKHYYADGEDALEMKKEL